LLKLLGSALAFECVFFNGTCVSGLTRIDIR